MLEVDIEKIIPVTDARDSLNQIIETVEGSDSMYVITKNGKPSAIIVGVHHLEKLTGMKSNELSVDEEPEAAAPVAPDTFPKTETVTKTTMTEVPENSTQAAPAPFTLAPEEDDIFAPLPEPEAPVVPAPAAATPAVEPLIDFSKTPTPAVPAAPTTAAAQASDDQL